LKIKFIPDSIAEFYMKEIGRVVAFFSRFDINPNSFTLGGMVLTLLSAIFICYGDFLIAGILILVGGTFDTIDGNYARATGRGSKFGALFDSTLDRYSEVFLFLGLWVFFIREERFISSFTTILALGGSMMVSYVRARSEGLGFECKVGIMQRQERVVYLGIGSIVSGIRIFSYIPIVAVVWLIAILANFTSIQRIYYIWKLENKGKLKTDESTE